MEVWEKKKHDDIVYLPKWSPFICLGSVKGQYKLNRRVKHCKTVISPLTDVKYLLQIIGNSNEL